MQSNIFHLFSQLEYWAANQLEYWAANVKII
jgi:hypothetical protein